MDKKVKLEILRRALRLIRHPDGWIEGKWVSGPDGGPHDARAAYVVGRKKQAGSNTPKVRCCIQGGCLIAAGELGVPFDDIYPLLGELDDRADEHFALESAIDVNDTIGQAAVVELLEQTIEQTEAR